MAKVRLTKNELKKQKDNLKRFTRYLPTLELKKKQLLLEIRRIQNEVEALDTASRRLEREISTWSGVFADEFDLHEYIKIEDVLRGRGNIAGIDIPTFEKVIFEDILDGYDPGCSAVFIENNGDMKSLFLEFVK